MANSKRLLQHKRPSGLLGALKAAETARVKHTALIAQCRAALGEPTCTPIIEITGLTKKGGPLTKRISLAADGGLHSDGGACVMSEGRAQRLKFDSLSEFSDYISWIDSTSAIALGAMRPDLRENVEVVTKSRLKSHHLDASPDTIARIHDYLGYRPGLPALALIDFDTKGLPEEVRDRIKQLGGLTAAIKTVLPELANVGRVGRRSTSACIRRTDTGQAMAGSDGRHIYVLVKDGSDIERFLRTLHERCWLSGLGWLMVGAGGQLLERSLVDRTVYGPERLVFEGAPILSKPLVQDQHRRRARAIEGPALDTMTACPPLRIAEKAKLDEMRAKEAHRLLPERTKARDRFIDSNTDRIVERTGTTLEVARRTVERQIDGMLLSDIELPFDDEEFQGCSVDDVLADPERFNDATLADPLEGIEYGRCKAKIMRRTDGSVWIHSFAHGRTVYELKIGARRIEAILNATPDAEAIDVLVRLVLDADIEDHDRERLRNAVSARTRVNKRTIDQAIKAALAERAARRQEEERDRRIAERRDPRQQILVPAPDAPWLPVVETLNDVLSTSSADEPPARDSDGYLVQVRVRRPLNMHTLTAPGANAGETDETRLPAPEHPLLTRLDDTAVAELIERYIDYVDLKGRQVHLPIAFVRHFVVRSDHVLPIMNAVATLPIVLPDGTILTGWGLNRDRGIVFRVPPKLDALIPAISECTPEAVATAMHFLANEWLCDVATNYQGKCILIAIAATIIERTELSERPAFFISAGQRGGGKTTALNMIAVAALGSRAAAAAWSPSEEERRKALFAYLSEGIPLIAWDNIPRGSSISCPSIERALTAELYRDRVLGVSEIRTAPATTIQVFNGNNVSPRGDLASRAPTVRLAVNRPDPENRKFKHPDPLAWTEANRGRILQALYTVLLGNPRLRDVTSSAAETRFKVWFHLVGSAIEHAAQQHTECDLDAEEISFREIFLEGEADDEQGDGLATVLNTLREKWPAGFKASDVSRFIKDADVSAFDEPDEDAIEFKAALEQACGKAIRAAPKKLTWQLKALRDAPIDIDGKRLVLRYTADHKGHGGDFRVEEIRR